VPRIKKAAVFVRCTEDEAERIRRTAKAERRTVSGFVLNAVFNRIACGTACWPSSKRSPGQKDRPASPSHPQRRSRFVNFLTSRRLLSLPAAGLKGWRAFPWFRGIMRLYGMR
jgi:hypothetical protein